VQKAARLINSPLWWKNRDAASPTQPAPSFRAPYSLKPLAKPEKSRL
jgi:hypothetical protein